MRSLSLIAALTFAPMFMGDTFQVFTTKQWGFDQRQTSLLFTFVAISGVVANSASGALIRRLGLSRFSSLATLSSLVQWLGFCTGELRVALATLGLGVLGPARTLGVSVSMTAEGVRRGIPQGQLSGDRANMVAWLKVVGPLLYGQLYVRGDALGVPQAPFGLNALLALVSLLLGAAALRDEPPAAA